jgi:formimidoylglutamate deiminase
VIPHVGTLFAPRAWLPSGWAEGVLLEFGADGVLISVETDQVPGDHECARGIVVPGIPNLHSHAFQRGLAGRTERAAGSRDTFWSWRDGMYRFLGALTPRDVEVIAAKVYVEMLKAGYTSVGEFHYLRRTPTGDRYVDPDELARRILEAADSTGIRATLLPVVYETGGLQGQRLNAAQQRFAMGAEEALETTARLRGRVARSDRLAVGLALHSLRAVHERTIHQVADWPDDVLGGPIHVHVAEQALEVEECLTIRGARPVEWLLANAEVDASWCLIHCTHTNRTEAAALAASQAAVALCPTTEANLGDGVFALPDYLAAGGRWGVGSDSHVCVNPVEELRWLEYGQRLFLQERNVAAATGGSTANALLGDAWASGSSALGQPVGRLEAGHAADLLVLDPEGPALAGHDSSTWLDAWVFSAAQPPRDVMVGGRWMVVDGHHPAEDAVDSRYGRTMREIAGRS